MAWLDVGIAWWVGLVLGITWARGWPKVMDDVRRLRDRIRRRRAP